MDCRHDTRRPSFADHARTWLGDKWSGSLFALALTWATGCTLIHRDEFDKKQCRTQADCDPEAALLRAPLECRQEVCQAPKCTQTADCPGTSVCTGNVCVAPSADAGTGGIACTQDSECGTAEQRCGFDGYCYAKWRCLSEELKWPATPFNVTYATSIQRLEAPTDPSAVRDVRIEMCALTDQTCMRPLVTADQVTIAADATVLVPLISGTSSSSFVGVVRFTTPNAGGMLEQIIPTYRVFTTETPLAGNMTDPIALTLFGPQLLGALAAAGGVFSVDPTKALVHFFIADCGGRPAPGVSVSVLDDADAVFVPVSGTLPVLESNVTPEAGTGTMLNVAGKLQKFVLRDEARQLVVTNTLTFAVNAAAASYVIYYPRNSALEKWLAQVERQRMAAQ